MAFGEPMGIFQGGFGHEPLSGPDGNYVVERGRFVFLRASKCHTILALQKPCAVVSLAL